MSEATSVLLVVDDDEFNRDMLSRRLNRVGYDARSVASGKEALDFLALHSTDLVLLDVQMPEMSGLEVLQTIRQHPSWARLPVLMVTAKDQSEDVVTALELGADDYITKPVDFPVTFARIRTHLSRSRLEARARLSEERFALASAFLDGLWDWRIGSNDIYFSARWKAILGYEDHELSNHIDEWFDRVHPQDLPRVRRDITAHLDGLSPHFESEYRMCHKSGAFRWMLTRGVAVRDRAGTVIRLAGSHADITEGKVVDGLTGLPNRVVLSDRLERLLQQQRSHSSPRFAALFLDVDRFKFVNDSIGHHGGDQLLQAIARRLEVALRSTDLVVRPHPSDAPSDALTDGHTLARLGGDEFFVLLENIHSATDAIQIAQRIQHALSCPFQIGDREIFASASIGVAVGHEGYASPDEVLRDADTAMYRAKALGPGRWEVFSVGMREQALQRIQLDTGVRRGAERHEFVPYFQPIIDLKTGVLAGFEALLRWQHPERGIVSPSEFLPIIEENGLLLSIGRRFLQDCCRQMRQWKESHPVAHRLWINVNFSSQQFLEAGLAGRLIESLDTCGLEPQQLVVEITERTAIANFTLTATVLEQLRRAGIRVVLDDFGTGYSALTYLHQLPISGLKLDPTFIQGHFQRPEILKAVIAIAESLDLTLTAEGIETTDQCSRLRAMGCDFAQGYLFARPLPADQAGELLTLERNWLEQRVSACATTSSQQSEGAATPLD